MGPYRSKLHDPLLKSERSYSSNPHNPVKIDVENRFKKPVSILFPSHRFTNEHEKKLVKISAFEAKVSSYFHRWLFLHKHPKYSRHDTQFQQKHTYTLNGLTFANLPRKTGSRPGLSKLITRNTCIGRRKPSSIPITQKS